MNDIAINDVRERPEFFQPMVHAVWEQWWESQGVSRQALEKRAAETLSATPIPFALVAHRNDAFIGTAAVVASDMDERPDYTPWVAALWVAPGQRGSGTGRRLVGEAVTRAFRLGVPRLYLCARQTLRGFYQQQGWRLLETAVGTSELDVFVCEAQQ